jgi:Family of unknown function (DUF6527)
MADTPHNVTFHLDEDGHLWWGHFCTGYARRWANFPDELVKNGEPIRLPLGHGHWEVVSTEPLTINPSISCGSCTVHGFIRNGEWVPV